MSKYARLHEHLLALRVSEWRPTFKEVEEILGFSLPASSRSHPAWWANNGDHGYSSAWLDAGWQTEDLNLTGERVTFRRVGRPAPGHRLPGPSVGRRSAMASALSEAEPLGWDTSDSLEYRIEMRWAPIGRVVLDDNARLTFPKVPAAPGLYRLRIRSTGSAAAYFGETDNLARRFGNYRNPGPTQQTSLRINAKLKHALGNAAQIAVATVTEHAWIERMGARTMADLNSKPVRRLFECAAIIEGGGTDDESLNR